MFPSILYPTICKYQTVIKGENMNTHDFKVAKANFRYDEVENSRKNLHKTRKEFVDYFTPARIAKMDIDEYVIGKGSKEHNFCYGLERTLDGLGRILGATSRKFGVFYSSNPEDGSKPHYEFATKFGDSYKEAFETVRNELLALLKAGKEGDIDAIVENMLSPMFKGKILSTYYPERYLNIFSPEHLCYYLSALGIADYEKGEVDAVIMREMLVDFKNSDPDMKDWSLDVFARFLYGEYPKAPAKEGQQPAGNNYKDPSFPIKYECEFIELSIDNESKPVKTAKTGKGGKVDYAEQERQYTLKGNRGEMIVYNEELNIVGKTLNLSGKKLEKAVVWTSKISDQDGYDILSKDKAGNDMYIEVKATSSKPGAFTFYYTANELSAAVSLGKAYHIYIVFEITTNHPKIWDMGNPFLPGFESLKLEPIKFKVDVNVNK